MDSQQLQQTQNGALVQVLPADELAAKQAFTVEQRIIGTVHQMREGWVILAEDLYQFNQQAMWANLGHDSFEEWLASPTIGLSRRTVYQLIDIWRALVIKEGVDPEGLKVIEPARLQEVLPAIRRKQVTVAQAIADVQELSGNDLRERYRPAGGGTTPTAHGAAPDTSTAYNAESEPSYVICPTCSSRVRETEIQ
jgi:hypothetical protein